MKYYGEALGGMFREQALVAVAAAFLTRACASSPRAGAAHDAVVAVVVPARAARGKLTPRSLRQGVPQPAPPRVRARHRVGRGGSDSIRGGYRYIWHRAGARVGFGAGIGSTGELRGPDTPRASLSPELLVHYGRCCLSGYLLLSAPL